MFSTKNQADCFNFEQASWKNYQINTIKKCNGQEFSDAGLLINLSIAFFIVIASASALSMIKNFVL